MRSREEPLIWSPSEPRVATAVGALGYAVFFGIVSVAFASAISESSIRYIAALPAVAFGVIAAFRASRIQLRIDERGLEITNLWSRKFVLWEHVAGLKLRWLFIGGPRLVKVVGIQAADGSKTLPCHATYADHGSREILIARLRSEAENRNIPILINPLDMSVNDSLFH